MPKESAKIIGKSVDMWGFGLMMVQLFTYFGLSRATANVKENKKLYAIVLKLLQERCFVPSMIKVFCADNLHETQAKVALSLVKELLKYDPSQRLSVGEVLRHEFFQCENDAVQESMDMQNILEGAEAKEDLSENKLCVSGELVDENLDKSAKKESLADSELKVRNCEDLTKEKSLPVPDDDKNKVIEEKFDAILGKFVEFDADLKDLRTKMDKLQTKLEMLEQTNNTNDEPIKIENNNSSLQDEDFETKAGVSHIETIIPNNDECITLKGDIKYMKKTKKLGCFSWIGKRLRFFKKRGPK